MSDVWLRRFLSFNFDLVYPKVGIFWCVFMINNLGATRFADHLSIHAVVGGGGADW